MTPCDDCGTLTAHATTIAIPVSDPARQFASAAWIVCPRCLGLRERVATRASAPPVDYRITSAQLARLSAIARRLYIENRLTGDEMRDIAQQLHATIEAIFELPIAEDAR